MANTPKFPFGNPETKAFDRQFLRDARHGETVVRVHQRILPLVSRILIGLDQMGVDISGASNSDDPLRLGFKLDVGEQATVVQSLVAPAGFTYTDGVFAFTGTPEEAGVLSAAIGVSPDAVVVEDVQDEPQEAPEISPEKIGGRVEVGSEGITVTFIQHLIGAPITGSFDSETERLLKKWQERHWAEPDGTTNEATWDSMLPTRGGWLRPGSTGNQIKTLQAAFLTLGFQNSPITGVWGTRFSHSLRLLQGAYGLQQRNRVGPPEWVAIFDPDKGVAAPAEIVTETV